MLSKSYRVRTSSKRSHSPSCDAKETTAELTPRVVGASLLVGLILCSLIQTIDADSCICHSKFYKICPLVPSCTRDNYVPCDKQAANCPELGLRDSTLSHDFDDPDHVTPSLEKPYGILDGDNSRVPVGHRKVYVKSRNEDPPIHPIRITIPVKLPVVTELPTPKPIYRLRTYTVQEDVPETRFVPVKKTVIKPVGLEPDQIVTGDPQPEDMMISDGIRTRYMSSLDRTGPKSRLDELESKADEIYRKLSDKAPKKKRKPSQLKSLSTRFPKMKM